MIMIMIQQHLCFDLIILRKFKFVKKLNQKIASDKLKLKNKLKKSKMNEKIIKIYYNFKIVFFI